MFPMTVTFTLDSPGQLNALMAAMEATKKTAPSPAVALKAEPTPVKLTAEQQAAVDDTAGLEEVNKNQGKARSAPTAPTSPTAEGAKGAAQEQKAKPSEAPAKSDTASEKSTASASSTTGSANADTAIDYKTLQEAVFKLAGKSRAAAMEVNQAMGVKTMKELPAERWAEALAAVEAKINELG